MCPPASSAALNASSSVIWSPRSSDGGSGPPRTNGIRLAPPPAVTDGAGAAFPSSVGDDLGGAGGALERPFTDGRLFDEPLEGDDVGGVGLPRLADAAAEEDAHDLAGTIDDGAPAVTRLRGHGDFDDSPVSRALVEDVGGRDVASEPDDAIAGPQGVPAPETGGGDLLTVGRSLPGEHQWVVADVGDRQQSQIAHGIERHQRRRLALSRERADLRVHQ